MQQFDQDGLVPVTESQLPASALKILAYNSKHSTLINGRVADVVDEDMPSCTRLSIAVRYECTPLGASSWTTEFSTDIQCRSH